MNLQCIGCGAKAVAESANGIGRCLNCRLEVPVQSDTFMYGEQSPYAQTVMQQPAYGEQCADTDGMALRDEFEGRHVATYRCLLAAKDAQLNQQAGEIAERGTRIANHDRTIATLMTQLIGKDATIAGLRTEAQRLSELAQDLQAQLNARHGAAGEPQTGAPPPCETPRVNPFAHGWATNFKMRGV